MISFEVVKMRENKILIRWISEFVNLETDKTKK